MNLTARSIPTIFYFLYSIFLAERSDDLEVNICNILQHSAERGGRSFSPSNTERGDYSMSDRHGIRIQCLDSCSLSKLSLEAPIYKTESCPVYTVVIVLSFRERHTSLPMLTFGE